MSSEQQVFQTNSRWRWRTFQWTTRLVMAALVLMIPVVIITLARGLKPGLPMLANQADAQHQLSHPVEPAGLNKKESRKYKGFDAFLRAKDKNEQLTKHPAAPHLTKRQVRAAFYVDWDPQSFYSLQQHIDQLNMVVPEWFFIDPHTDTLRAGIDQEALQLMHQKQVRIVPLINNTNEALGEGAFDGDMMHRILHNPAKRDRLINDIVKYLDQYQLQGINIDFEDFKENSDEPIIAFQKALYEKLHPKGYLVTQDIMPHDADFNVKRLQAYNDYMFLMAYDEHFATSVPGSVSGQQWIEKVLDETASDVPTDKLIVCVAGYGYDWPRHMEGTTVTYQQALAGGRQYNATIQFDNNSYSNHYQYTDANGLPHDVYFNDAATNFNTVRFADEYGAAGTALWRLGSEDDRLWTFYSRNLTNKALAAHPFDYNKLKEVKTAVERPDYIGDGEVLNVLTDPQPGKIDLSVDSTEGLIGEQRYVQLPTRYVIRKYGVVHKQVALTFDDGPDPAYTPQVLDILKKEQVPAAFFVIGVQAENNLPLLKRIYREGHEIGNHTFTHPNIAAVSAERAGTEMEATRLLIEAITGRSTILFRAPYNADSEPSTDAELRPISLSKQQNYYTVGESIDPNDWEPGVTADSVYNRTIREYEANPSKGIILLHDAGGYRQATVDALPRIIHYFKQHGIAFTTISGLLGKTRDEVMPPVNNHWVAWNGGIATVGYWLGHFLTAAFWVAIVLGFVRIGAMAIMAIGQKIRSRREERTAPAIAGMSLKDLPAVSIIVPAYNEEINAVKTIQNLLQQDYPSFDILFVDDGSKDKTFDNVSAAFAGNDRVRVFTKPNGGKASALNYGLAQTDRAFVICIDADTQLKQDAVSQLMRKFQAASTTTAGKQPVPLIGAVAGNVKVGNENNMLTRWQSIEYTTAQNFDRRAFDLINGITVVPGAIGAFRKEAIEAAGGFTRDTLAEDCDLTIRILRGGYQVVNCTAAIAVTEAPETLQQFMKQRFRWSYGVMQAFWKNRDACFNPKYKALGMVSLPNILLFQIILPVLAPLADVMFVLSLVWNRHDPGSMHKILFYYLVFFVVDVLVSVVAFVFEQEKPSKLLWLIPQRLVYRQLMYVILFRSIRKAIKGEGQGWGVLQRTGSVKQLTGTIAS